MLYQQHNLVRMMYRLFFFQEQEAVSDFCLCVVLRRALPLSAIASGRDSRSRTMPMIWSSPISSPRSITAFTCRPSSESLCTASRRMSPVETLGIPCSRANRSACVPLPAPGGPSITRLSATLSAPSPDPRLLHEPIVMPHDQQIGRAHV